MWYTKNKEGIMKEYGFIRVGAAVPELSVANPKFNVERIIEMIEEAAKKEIGILVFPELYWIYLCGFIYAGSVIK